MSMTMSIESSGSDEEDGSKKVDVKLHMLVRRAWLLRMYSEQSRRATEEGVPLADYARLLIEALAMAGVGPTEVGFQSKIELEGCLVKAIALDLSDQVAQLQDMEKFDKTRIKGVRKLLDKIFEMYPDLPPEVQASLTQLDARLTRLELRAR